MGLLDGMDFNDPKNQGLLAAAAQILQQSGSSRMPVGLGQIVGGGLSAFNGGMQAAQQRKLEQDQMQQVAQLRGLQIQEAQGGLQDHERARKQAEALRQAYIDINSPTGQAQKILGVDMAPTLDNASKLSAAGQGPAGATPQGTAGGIFEQRMGLAQQLRARGFHDQADAQEAAALKFKPKFDNTPHVVMGADGKPVLVQTADDGTVRPIQGGYGVAEKLAFHNLGGRTVGVNPFTGAETADFKNTQSPDSVASNASAAAGRAQSERHFQAEQSTPQYMDTQDGIMALPKRLAPGVSPTGRPVFGPDGQPLEKKQNTPQYIVQAITSNAKSLSSIDAALASLGAAGGKDAVGYKGYLPNSLLNRLYPGGTETRANISDVGSLILHDRSGAAVTAAESPRLMPFIPLATDDAETAKKKLSRFKQIFEAETNNLTFAFPQAKKLAEYAESQTSGQPAKPARKSVIKGQIIDGYRFQGGEPGDKNNWEKI